MGVVGVVYGVKLIVVRGLFQLDKNNIYMGVGISICLFVSLSVFVLFSSVLLCVNAGYTCICHLVRLRKSCCLFSLQKYLEPNVEKQLRHCCKSVSIFHFRSPASLSVWCMVSCLKHV